jgi:hypothetical protein
MTRPYSRLAKKHFNELTAKGFKPKLDIMDY